MAVGNLPCSELANVHLNLFFNGGQVGYSHSFCLASTPVALGAGGLIRVWHPQLSVDLRIVAQMGSPL